MSESKIQQAERCMKLLDEIIIMYNHVRANMHNFNQNNYDNCNLLKSAIESGIREVNITRQNEMIGDIYHKECKIVLNRLFYITESFLDVHVWFHTFTQNTRDVRDIIERSYKLLFGDIFLSGLILERPRDYSSSEVFLKEDWVIKHNEIEDFVRILKFMIDCLKDELCTNSDELLLMKTLKDMIHKHIVVYEKNLENDASMDRRHHNEHSHRHHSDEDERTTRRARIET